MSETEGQQVTTQETGRCEKAAHEVTHSSWNQQFNESVLQMTIASTIDRLAADVASIKAKVEQIAPEDVRHFVDSEKAWVKLVEEQRDAAIRERDEARAEVERLKAELHTEIHGHMASRVEVERLRAELAALQPATVSDAQAAMDKDRAVVQRHCAAEQAADAPPAAPKPTVAAQKWTVTHHHTQGGGGGAGSAGFVGAVAIASNGGRGNPSKTSNSSPAAPQPAAPTAWWLTDEERAQVKHLLLIQRHNTGWTTERHAELDRILSRAGSPPVVVLPTVFQRGSLGDELVALQQVKDSLVAAGVAWKEVGRE